MNAKIFYDSTAERYDERHNNARTKYMRALENKLIKKYAFGKVLDIGCGTGQHLDKSDIGLDVSLPILTEARKKGHSMLVQSKAEELPFADNCFDSVLCIFTVLNLCDYNEAVKEMHRVLKKNGIAVVSAASIWDHSKDNLFKRLAKRKSHTLKMRIEKSRFRFFVFNKTDLIKIFTENNFRLVRFRGLYTLAKPYWGWHRDHSFSDRVKLHIAFSLESLLQPLNKSARMYFGVFQKKEN